VGLTLSRLDGVQRPQQKLHQTELDFSGDRAMISLRAATMIQNWAEDKNSKDMVKCAVVLLA
jgi:hypothetical protein